MGLLIIETLQRRGPRAQLAAANHILPQRGDADASQRTTLETTKEEQRNQFAAFLEILLFCEKHAGADVIPMLLERIGGVVTPLNPSGSELLVTCLSVG